ncbi:uncharacterized protein LOC107264810 isoform X2 [Cephus cinctus]|uniref:Uncharacterized protein LOC107264810 isoform X2 n=1 Tax=Cephus cinctus TaxID=211228 RepID=A0AAJ7RBE0_CEPCN|nr:uncharacterized protein LOC107264810 isoform X2 [Cephus cinctus]XP_024937779.1 uncharacterized protein LOC107264810 isoform X2 [Cephus cinctus]XP_024937780.1 uncharacterized protein LOC107264810 isoform X2 [Cephus cinctus]XP_024937781.1 uncharacterized protein LOC107264810 isoform X2 [Cephus cinctus]
MIRVPETDTETDNYVSENEVAPSTDGGKADKTEAEDENGTSEAEEEREEINANVGRKKKKSKKKVKDGSCLEEDFCDEKELWRVYMKSYVEKEERLEAEDKFARRKAANLLKLPNVKSEEDISVPYECLYLNAFSKADALKLPDKLNRKEKIRIWKSLETKVISDADRQIERKLQAEAESEKFPEVWPCADEEYIEELKKIFKRNKKKEIFPLISEEREELLELPKENFAERKELGHARIPPACPTIKSNLMVDRAAGEHPGLVDGDYVIFELVSKKKGNRTYADVCLRGMKGMHLQELEGSRSREKTWKFCFYQALVALLAKTQLRYRYAWSANLDYIYDHAWMLYVHIGSINLREKQRFDDVIVYNYKYSVEIELVCETKDVPRVNEVEWDYIEKNFKKKLELERKELMHTNGEINSQKIKDQQNIPVHKCTKVIENWFDQLDVRYQNCIFRTTRYSLAFWKDDFFWYLYNPYRCDKFGFWDDSGYACIMKFCSRDSLRRHLMILLLRAYVYETPKSEINDKVNETDEIDQSENNQGKRDTIETTDESIQEIEKKEDVLTIQIYQMIYHKTQLYNIDLLQKSAPKPQMQDIEKQKLNICPIDPMETYDPCKEYEDNELIEKVSWLKTFKITWPRCQAIKKKSCRDNSATSVKLRWHQYYVEEPYKIFSLWAEIHPTEQLFPKENRGKQSYACYAVCAGMTRITAPEYWTPKTLDAIVMCGDKYYTLSKLEAEALSEKTEYSQRDCWDKYLTEYFKIGETLFQVKILPSICGKLYSKLAKYLWQTLEQMFVKYHFGILTCENTCVGLFKFCGAYYMCDVQSWGPPLFQYGHAVAYLLRSTSFFKFMTILILTIGSPECSRFSLNPIEIVKVIEVGSADTPKQVDAQNRRKTSSNTTKVTCPYEDDKKPDPKKWRPKSAQSERKTIDKTICKDESSKKRFKNKK